MTVSSILSSFTAAPQLVKARPVTAESVAAARAEQSMAENPLIGNGSVATPGVWLTGTGTPKLLPDRAGPSTLLSFGTNKVLVDCGAGTAARLASLGVDPAEITHLLLTHHHIDHNSELAFLLLAPWVNRERPAAPLIAGPAGTRVFVDRILAAHDYDVRTRVPFGISPEALAPDVLELSDGTVLRGDGWTATAFDVNHSPVEEALGFRFDWAGGSLGISGDTTPCENLVEHCQDVDVLIHEVLYPGYGFSDYHTTVHDVGRVAADSKAKRLVLTHLLPGHLQDEVWLGPIAERYAGETTVGRDLLRVL